MPRRRPAGQAPSTAGTITAGRRPAASTAMSWAGSERTRWMRLEVVPSANVTLYHGGALDDVKGRQDVALGVDDHPGAEVFGAVGPSCWASMTTSPARTASYAVTAAGG